MLSLDQIYDNKEKFLSKLSTLDFDMTKLYQYLEDVHYFEAPLTTNSDQSYPGGLCENALTLYRELKVISNAYFPGKYSEEDFIKVAFFKNLYKVEMFEQVLKNRKNPETNEWEEYPAYQTKAERRVFGDLGFSSYMIAKNFISFTDEQIEAICHGSGLDSFSRDSFEICRNYPLVVLTRMADLANCFFVNGEKHE